MAGKYPSRTTCLYRTGVEKPVFIHPWRWRESSKALDKKVRHGAERYAEYVGATIRPARGQLNTWELMRGGRVIGRLSYRRDYAEQFEQASKPD